MPTITLRDVNRENWRDCIRLNVHPAQQEFVAPNLYTLAEAHYEPGCVLRAIYSDETIVGLLMFGFDETQNQYWTGRMMIDERHQGKGYGREAILALLKSFRESGRGGMVVLTVVPDNHKAIDFYDSLGFGLTGETIENGELVMQRKL